MIITSLFSSVITSLITGTPTSKTIGIIPPTITVTKSPTPSTTPPKTGHVGRIVGGAVGGGVGVILIGVAALFYRRWKGGKARPAPILIDRHTETGYRGGMTEQSSVTGWVGGAAASTNSTSQQNQNVRDFMSHAATIMCLRASFSYYFHTPRTQITQITQLRTGISKSTTSELGQPPVRPGDRHVDLAAPMRVVYPCHLAVT